MPFGHSQKKKFMQRSESLFPEAKLPHDRLVTYL